MLIYAVSRVIAYSIGDKILNCYARNINDLQNYTLGNLRAGKVYNTG